MNSLTKKFLKLIRGELDIPAVLMKIKILRLLPTRAYINLIYKKAKRLDLDLKNPKSFNDKLQWMKLHYRNPLCTDRVDKYKVRQYISETIGGKYLIPLIGVYDSPDEINFDMLPDQFVIKCNHNSGSVIICKDKKNFDVQNAKKKLNALLKENYYYKSREWAYKNIKRKIICEKYMVDESGMELKDYKFFCFDGEPKVIEVDYNRFLHHKRNIYDTDWNYLNIEMRYPSDPNVIIKKPEKLDEMLDIASILSKGFPHVRVDLYSIGNDIYFGEFTFCHHGGGCTFKPEEFNYTMGGWLDLPEAKK